MSTAINFATLSPFPDCPFSTAQFDSVFGAGFYQWARNLTLSQAMKFYWNLENFTLTTSASVSGSFGGKTYSGTANGTFTFNPPAVTGDWTEDDLSGNIGGWIFNNLSSPYTPSKPRERVCSHTAYPVQVASVVLSDTRGSNYAGADIEVVLAEDSVNAGKYAIGINFFLSFPLTGSDGSIGAVSIDYIYAVPSHSFNSGTFTLGGVTFNYWCGVSLALSGLSTSGGTLACSSSDYTY